MELASIHSPVAAFVAGLITSLHCAGMCGPLACALMPMRGDPVDGRTVATIYHLCRLGAYAALGAIAGGLGRVPLTWISQSALRWLPWALVLFFIALALRWDRFLPKLAAPVRLLGRLQPWMRRQSRVGAAAVLGFATPLLPCGPLYFLVTLALLSGSALHGVEFMLAFGLGTVPLLWMAQSHFQWLRMRLSPLWLARLRLGLALSAALVSAWRLRGTIGLGGPDPAALLCLWR
ncbi:MAG TPA: sulfite exporter TauE/SafE family protein [Opitutaceae bacterium]|nr:sulfite exporter TauE/SafE family protein [Opitutaceae bacterium]HWB96484.1 sulfite exporter TauE/SafE family protein [Bryobacteraceae bacterium]